MSTIDPLTLRLPRWLCQSFDLARVIANEHRTAGRSAGVCHYDRFDMRSQERAFVKIVLARHTNLWLFRTNQRRACGDVIAIDMSSSRRSDRRAYVMELKMNTPLVVGGAHLQLAHHAEAIDELVARAVLGDRSPVELLYGDDASVLAHVAAR
jgi:hypothetical protein